MNVCKNEILDAIEAELEAINEDFQSIGAASIAAHEAFKEAESELAKCQKLRSELRTCIGCGRVQGTLLAVTRLKYTEIQLIQKACHAVAMAIKAEQSIADKMSSEKPQ